VAITDLALEGLGLELMKLGASSLDAPPVSTEEARIGLRLYGLEQRCAASEGALAEARRESASHQQTAAELRRVLDSVEASWSFRLGRALTSPARWLRRS
jgi:hypothetical protein